MLKFNTVLISTLSFLKVIKLSTLESVKVELLIFLINSLKVIIIFELTTTSVSKSAGLNVKIGTALSGGLDSSSVYCMLHELQRKGKISKDLINNFVADAGTTKGSSADDDASDSGTAKSAR